MTRPRNATGLTRVEVVVTVLVSTILLSLLPPVLWHMKSDATRVACGANLATIGKAMLVYAGDYEGELPRAGGRNSTWGPVNNWMASNRIQAFGLDAQGGGGSATISSCFYLLVKYMGLEPRQFVCPGDKGTIELKLSDVHGLPEGFTLADAWDFAPGVGPHCSYAYQMPFSMYALKTSDDPAAPVAADCNPWIGRPDRAPKSLADFAPDLPPFQGTRAQVRAGNSMSHGEDGQNVLFLDGHVTFEERSHCGLDTDDIYLVSNDATRGSPVGTVPAPPLVPLMSRRDSVLVHDPPEFIPISYVADTVRQTDEVDSKSLKQTAVVATLDCPLPKHKNAIWCSTFQMAWDTFGRGIIGEPIQIPGAEDMAKRLNEASFPPGSIEEKSYYAVAGFVKNGVIGQVQREMKQRFPLEPVPTFDNRYTTPSDVVLAYAYLNVEVGFKYPYYAYTKAFDFLPSAGERSGVMAFCAQAEVRGGNHEQIRSQAEVLFYEGGETSDPAQFAVDLSQQTQPYQVILARMTRCNTLREATNVLQKKTSEFKNDPDYTVLRRLRPSDTLIAPDIAYRLTHRFDELLSKRLGNPQWPNTFLFEALQQIDFALSRKGVVVKSAARMAATTAKRAPSQLAQPRRLYFNRPFLICVQKREPDATPFFLMWVDNAELMTPYNNPGRP